MPTHTVEYLALPIWRTIADLLRYEQDLGLSPSVNPKLRVPPSLDIQGLWAGRRFRHDLRLDNVAVMLDSQFQTLLPMKQRPNQLDADFREEQEQFLLSCSLRTLSQAFGRACVIYHCTPVSMDLKLHVSSLCLTGRGHPYHRVIDINNADMDATVMKMIDWGHFYNGVSHGLSLMGSEQISFDPMWLGLCYARQRDIITGAGVVYAFGLSGHINLINMYTIHEWLAKGDTYLVASILLGSAITARGTCDINVHKMEKSTRWLPLISPLCSQRLFSSCISTHWSNARHSSP
uniref:Anaphase-promoting complex subunit 1 n=1 Tax=Steinernema glaseri TaxID=37863 RepID=A0A1I7ZIB3_9BILA